MRVSNGELHLTREQVEQFLVEKYVSFEMFVTPDRFKDLDVHELLEEVVDFEMFLYLKPADVYIDGIKVVKDYSPIEG